MEVKVVFLILTTSLIEYWFGPQKMPYKPTDMGKKSIVF